MKEFKVSVSTNSEGKVIMIEPVNRALGKTVETKIMTARLLTDDDISREIREAMQDGCRTYKRVGRRIRETR